MLNRCQYIYLLQIKIHPSQLKMIPDGWMIEKVNLTVDYLKILILQTAD